ncbi:hypothetical protein BDZ85DRAFT_127302 [Elsinoe ampelina]|uniref:Transcription factor domain-containing protein n=1 Tax=Elsinoe ampelina TaxID=302913 RepID=A0A6A6G9H8_9PEZI|nr:hypothetical protein BDZ85DRAFT_127302 [Elsinoe ampelina]
MKTRCDEHRPICGRWSNLGRACVYSERTRTSEEDCIDELQAEVLALKERLQFANHVAAVSPTSSIIPTISSAAPPTSYSDHIGSHVFKVRPAKRQKTSFDIRTDTRSSIPDFVTEGIITETQASYYFECFFEGSDRFLPVFDESDTFTSIRARDGLLVDAICPVGCGASRDITMESRTLHVRLKRWLSTVILSPSMHCLEAVQALLVTACWTPKNKIVTAVALNMALDLNLASSFDSLLQTSLRQSSSNEAVQLMKRARTWFALVVLAQILQVGAGDLLGFSIRNVRRCRLLLN